MHGCPVTTDLGRGVRGLMGSYERMVPACWSAQRSMRMTARRGLGWLSSAKPTSANTSWLPTWRSPQVMSLPGRGDHRLGLERASAAVTGEVDGGAERVRDAALAEALADDEHVTAQTLSSVLSSSRPIHGVRVRSRRG